MSLFCIRKWARFRVKTYEEMQPGIEVFLWKLWLTGACVRTIIGTKRRQGEAISVIDGTEGAHCKSLCGSRVLFKYCRYLLAQFQLFSDISSTNILLLSLTSPFAKEKPQTERITNWFSALIFLLLPHVDQFGSHTQWRCDRDIYTVSRITKSAIRKCVNFAHIFVNNAIFQGGFLFN